MNFSRKERGLQAYLSEPFLLLQLGTAEKRKARDVDLTPVFGNRSMQPGHRESDDNGRHSKSAKVLGNENGDIQRNRAQETLDGRR